MGEAVRESDVRWRLRIDIEADHQSRCRGRVIARCADSYPARAASNLGGEAQGCGERAAPSMAELEPSPNSETHEAASPSNVTRPRDQDDMRILVTLSK